LTSERRHQVLLLDFRRRIVQLARNPRTEDISAAVSRSEDCLGYLLSKRSHLHGRKPTSSELLGHFHIPQAQTTQLLGQWGLHLTRQLVVPIRGLEWYDLLVHESANRVAQHGDFFAVAKFHNRYSPCWALGRPTPASFPK